MLTNVFNEFLGQDGRFLIAERFCANPTSTQKEKGINKLYIAADLEYLSAISS